MTGTPSSASESMVSRYSSTGGWYSAGECWVTGPVGGSPGMAVPLAGGARWHVERGIAVEEAHRDERETGVLDRHDGPVLGPGQVGHPEGVPQHDVGVDDVPVLS